ncbi:hypothetical protein LTR04_001826 [Oleoguttula sp. CCFEE 6159]|nr:hypothetical protein LTR04_001826 [Oleoguttula sp. CCFEE 6159]
MDKVKDVLTGNQAPGNVRKEQQANPINETEGKSDQDAVQSTGKASAPPTHGNLGVKDSTEPKSGGGS